MNNICNSDLKSEIERLWSRKNFSVADLKNISEKFYGEFTDKIIVTFYFDQSFTREADFIENLLKISNEGIFFIHEAFFHNIDNDAVVFFEKSSRVEGILDGLFEEVVGYDSWTGYLPPAGLIVDSHFEWMIWTSAIGEIASFGSANDISAQKFKNFSLKFTHLLSNDELMKFFSNNNKILNEIFGRGLVTNGCG